MEWGEGPRYSLGQALNLTTAGRPHHDCAMPLTTPCHRPSHTTGRLCHQPPIATMPVISPTEPCYCHTLSCGSQACSCGL